MTWPASAPGSPCSARSAWSSSATPRPTPIPAGPTGPGNCRGWSVSPAPRSGPIPPPARPGPGPPWPPPTAWSCTSTSTRSTHVTCRWPTSRTTTWACRWPRRPACCPASTRCRACAPPSSPKSTRPTSPPGPPSPATSTPWPAPWPPGSVRAADAPADLGRFLVLVVLVVLGDRAGDRDDRVRGQRDADHGAEGNGTERGTTQGGRAQGPGPGQPGPRHPRDDQAQAGDEQATGDVEDEVVGRRQHHERGRGRVEPGQVTPAAPGGRHSGHRAPGGPGHGPGGA